MAHLLGAKQVEAFDIDSWCVDNGNENFDLNGVTTRMGLGTIREVQPQGPYELILANINKNVLLLNNQWICNPMNNRMEHRNE
jgi:ribosomal protein L11 methyltransferase